MNLHEQLGALEVGVDQLIQAVVAPPAENIPETRNENAAHEVVEQAASVADEAQAEAVDAEVDVAVNEAAAEPVPPTLEINRPAQNEITMTI
ncbi:MAG: hypothetical protein JF605_00995, partial [Burkholderia sp.]|nr:hypothetical protein [Burkholderia sp.]